MDPDECQLGDNDRNADDIPDDRQLVDNDCNQDLIPDDCQLNDNDCNGNNIPDDCDGGCECVCHEDVFESCQYSGEPKASLGAGEDIPESGAFVYYDDPWAYPTCEFGCINQGITERNGDSCRVTCDPVTGAFFPVGETAVTCISEVEVEPEVWEPVDECGFTVTVYDDCPEPD
ncbi:MAG: hypothetical protein JSU63_16530 [Phycisphaerales bacterium]|nr:MAG: hypothetical protein JSU63_16530 [Phycisphaerales bacterium]